MDEVPATHTPDDFEQFLARVPEHVRQERRLAATAKRRIRDIWGGSLDLLAALLHESRAMGDQFLRLEYETAKTSNDPCFLCDNALTRQCVPRDQRSYHPLGGGLLKRSHSPLALTA